MTPVLCPKLRLRLQVVSKVFPGHGRGAGEVRAQEHLVNVGD